MSRTPHTNTKRGGDAAVAVVIPTLNEADSLPLLLADLARLKIVADIVVVDGGSADATVSLARAAGARIVESGPGRGTQLRAGVRASTAPILCMVHADARMGARARHALECLARDDVTDAVAYAFSLSIDAPERRFRLVERAANARSRWLHLPYGDQGLVLSRTLYERAGGYADVPLMEDVGLVRALGRVAEIRLLPERLLVSSRRWRRAGIVRRTVLNVALLVAYYAGVPPHRLSRWYRSDRPRRQ